MRKITLGLLICLMSVSTVFSQQTTTNMDSLSYSVGVLIAQNLKQQGLTEVVAADLAGAIDDVLKGSELKISQEEANKVMQEHMRAQQMKMATAVIEEGKTFLKENGAKDGVITLPSGLQYEVINAGTGESPKATDKVTTHYHGSLINGQVFDSSVERGEPATFPVNGVIQGWVEALQLMKVGSKWRLFVPENLAYGERGAGEMIKPFSTLIFEVELLKIN